MKQATIACKLNAAVTFQSNIKDHDEPVQINVEFKIIFRQTNGNQRVADATQFDDIQFEVTDLDYGKDTITVVYLEEGIGILDVDTGDINIPITFVFRHSLPARASHIQFQLTTGSSTGPTPAQWTLQGAPVDKNSWAVKLVGQGTFADGHFKNDRCSVQIAGNFDKSPFPT